MQFRLWVCAALLCPLSFVYGAYPNEDSIEYNNHFRQLEIFESNADRRLDDANSEAYTTRLSFARVEKLFQRKAATRQEYLAAKAKTESAKIRVEEEKAVIEELQLDQKISKLRYEWAKGVPQDLVKLGEHHVARWENQNKLYELRLKRAQTELGYYEWAYQTALKLQARNAMSAQEVENALLEYEKALHFKRVAGTNLKKSETFIEEAKQTLREVKKNATP